MEALVIFILACYGMTSILVDGAILEPIRPKWKLFKCYQCMGFWVGIIMFTIFHLDGVMLAQAFNLYIGAFIFACLSSGTSYILGNLFGDFGLRTENKKNSGIL